jgi:hypothetical protein
MNLQQFLASNPLPPGTTRWGAPAPAIDCIQLCTYDIAQQLAAMLNASWSAAGLVPVPGLPAPAIVDGGASGTQSVNSDLLPVPPTQPFIAGQEGFFGYYGYLRTTQPLALGSEVIPAGTQVLVSESLGELQARGLVNPQGIPAGELGGEIDKNVIVGPTGTRYAVYTSLALQVQDGNIAQAYWVAP